MSKRLLDWFRDRAIKRVVRYGLPLTIGKAITSVSGLVTLALLARQLGPTSLGVLALIRTVAGVVEQYANFNTWQAVIKYGTEAMAASRTDDVNRIVKLAVVIDMLTAALASLVLIVLAALLPGSFGWSEHDAFLCMLYSITIVTRVAGATDGVFRICDAYRKQALATSVGAIASVIAVGAAVLAGAGLTGCVVALIIGEVIANVYIMAVAFKTAADAGYGAWWTASVRGARARFPGIGQFILATNAQLTVRKTMGEIDMVVVGSMLGKAAAGLFRVVKQLGTVPAKIFLPFEQVLFTELAHLAAAHDFESFRRVLRRTSIIATLGALAVWAVVAIAAVPIVRLVAGDEFVAAAEPLRWYLLAMVLGVANAPVLRSLIALGRPGLLFWLDVATLAVLVAGVIVGTWLAGLVGVSLAILVHRVVHMFGATWLAGRVIRTRAEDASQRHAQALT